MFLYTVESCLWCCSLYWCLCFANTYIALATDLNTNELICLLSPADHIFFSRLMMTKVPTSCFDSLSGCPWTMDNIVMNCQTSSLLLSIFLFVLMMIKGINTQGGTAQRKLHAESPDEHQTELISTWCVMFIISSVGDSHEMSNKLQWTIKWPDHYYADPTTVLLPEIKHQKKTGQLYFPVPNRTCKFPWKCMISDS